MVLVCLNSSNLKYAIKKKEIELKDALEKLAHN